MQATHNSKLPPLDATFGSDHTARLKSTLGSTNGHKDVLPEPLAPPHKTLAPLGANKTAPTPALRTGASMKRSNGPADQLLTTLSIEPPMDLSHRGMPTPGGRKTNNSHSSPAPGGFPSLKSKDDYSYVKLISTLRLFPNTDDFVYLRRADRDPSIYNPYALDVVPFTQVCCHGTPSRPAMPGAPRALPVEVQLH